MTPKAVFVLVSDDNDSFTLPSPPTITTAFIFSSTAFLDILLISPAFSV